MCAAAAQRRLSTIFVAVLAQSGVATADTSGQARRYVLAAHELPSVDLQDLGTPESLETPQLPGTPLGTGPWSIKADWQPFSQKWQSDLHAALPSPGGALTLRA